jgi:hypothetical protein
MEVRDDMVGHGIHPWVEQRQTAPA